MVPSMAINRQVLYLYLLISTFALSGTFGGSDKRENEKLFTQLAEERAKVPDIASTNPDFESVKGYEEVKEKLRKIFDGAVEPRQYEEEEEEDEGKEALQERREEFGDYLFKLNHKTPYSDPNIRQLTDDNNSLPQRRRQIPEDHEREGGNLSLQEPALEVEREELFLQGRHNEVNGRKRNSVHHPNRHHSGHEHTKHYLNEWVVHLTGGKDLAASVAKDLGYEFLGQVSNFDDVYRLVKRDHPTVHKREAPHLTHQLNVHAEVRWAEQQFIKERAKRSVLPILNLFGDGNYDPYEARIRTKRIKEEEEEEEMKIEEELREEKNRYLKEHEGKSHIMKKRSAMAANALEMEKMFNDELWVHQWYLFDTRTRSDLPKLDLQVVPVWESGVTGKSIRVLVLDDGLEWKHSDIIHNYDAEISYDFNNNDNDPSPRYDPHLSNSHGTRCAGEIVMEPNNKKCGVGVAYGASVGGVRMLDGPVSDVVEGSSLGWSLDKVDIVTCSWGPTDDGQRVEGPGRLAQMAIHKGVTEGRDGKGVVYVWAAGNGGSVGDDCNCDGYTSSIYTLSISSASETGLFPWYGERCSSTLAAAYSSGAYTDQKIATTDLHNSCTDKFSGTSAAAPLAAGIVALALEVNPDLTWRDMQHAVVWSSEWGPLGHNSGWRTNARGLKFNPRFGFGLLSAYGLVQTVKNWTRVPENVVCTVEETSRSSSTLKTGGSVVIKFEKSGCEGTEDEVRSLEHVQVISDIDYSRRGALSIDIISPSGTRTRLLSGRVEDDSTKGFKSWPFMSVHTWGEDPRGVWTVNVTDMTSGDESGQVNGMKLILHGTKNIPEHMRQQRSYRIPFVEKEENNVRRESEDTTGGGGGGGGLTSESLRDLPWQKLVDLLAQSTRSTFSDEDIKMLLRENRLEKALRSVQSESDGWTIADSDWRILLNEILSRK